MATEQDKKIDLKKDELEFIMNKEDRSYSESLEIVLSAKSIVGKDPLTYLLQNNVIDYKKIDGEKIYQVMKENVNKDNFKSYQEFADNLIKSGKAKTEMKSYHKILNKFGFYKDTAFVHGLKEEIKKHENIAKNEAAAKVAEEAKRAEARAQAEAKAAENARIQENAKKNLEEVNKKTAAKRAAAEAKEAAAKAAEKAAENAKKAKQDNVKAFIGGYQNVLKAEFKNSKTKEEIKNLEALIENTPVGSEKERLQLNLNSKKGMYDLDILEAKELRGKVQKAAESAGIPKEVVEACDKFVDAKVSLVAQNREKSNKILESHFINLATQDMGAKLQTSLEVMETTVSAKNAEDKVNEIKSELKEAVGKAGFNKDAANSFVDIVSSELDSIVLNDMANRYETQAMSAENTLKDPTLTPETKKALETSVKDNKKSEEICKEEAATRTEQSKSAQETFIAATTEQTSKSQVKGEEKSTRETSNIEQAMKQVREQNVLSGLSDVKSENVGSHSAPLTTTGVNKQTERNGGIGR